MVKKRTVDDPWYTVLYRDPHTLWWAPALFVAVLILLGNLFLFERSAVRSLALASLLGVAAALGAYVRRRRNRG